jgi:hypothetical protein
MAKPELMPVAEEMFVAQLANVADIATRLQVSEKTVRNWKARGGWDEKRAASLGAGSAISDRQMHIAVRVADLIDKLLDEGEVPPRHLFAYLLGAGGGAERARRFEELSRPQQDEGPKQDGPNPETLREAMRILGLDERP